MINDDTIYFLELKQDVLFRKINRNDYMYYIENCKSFARKIYDIYVQKYLKKIKGIFFESKLNACSEICAIEFSRLFTNSEINPKYIDYLALIKKGYIDYTYLEEAENELYNICK